MATHDLTEPATVDESVNVTPEVSVHADPEAAPEVVFDVSDLSVYYGPFRAVRDVNVTINKYEITAFIGPSGCGKTTVLRCFNRMNDLIAGAKVEGRLAYHGVDLYDERVNPVE